jgi:hypothetical protein
MDGYACAVLWQSGNGWWNAQIQTCKGQSKEINTDTYRHLIQCLETYMCNMNEDGTIPCKSCGSPTQMLGTELCDVCWERSRNVRKVQ